MYRKTLSFCLCIVFALLSLSGCGQQPGSQETNSALSNESWCTAVYLPGDIDPTHQKMLNLPNRQQFVYRSKDAAKRIAIDIHTGAPDEIAVENRQSIPVGPNAGEAYVYSGEAVTYSGVTQAMASGLIPMAEGETVLEWSQAGAFCRVFGTYPIEELVQFAEALEVRLP